MQDNIPIRKVKRRKKITIYNHGQITKQQLKIVMEITRQSSWLTAKTHFPCIVCLGAKFQPTEFTPKLGVKGKTVPMEMEIGSWQQAPSGWRQPQPPAPHSPSLPAHTLPLSPLPSHPAQSRASKTAHPFPCCGNKGGDAALILKKHQGWDKTKTHNHLVTKYCIFLLHTFSDTSKN